jgi:hypothetical protein
MCPFLVCYDFDKEINDLVTLDNEEINVTNKKGHMKCQYAQKNTKNTMLKKAKFKFDAKNY